MTKRILYDRSRVSKDWTCPRARYYGYEYEGRGLTDNKINLYLAIGSIVHEGLAAFPSGEWTVDEIAEEASAEVRQVLRLEHPDLQEEQAALVEGMLRGFNRVVWPRLQEEFPSVVSIEEEIEYRDGNLTFMSKPDLLVRNKVGQLYYIEYKTTSSIKEQWFKSFENNIQLHSAAKAIEAQYGEEPAGIIVQGLNKGYQTRGKQHSIFCYGYHRPGSPPFTREEWRFQYFPGGRKSPIWKKEGGVKAWVEAMPERVLIEQFPRVPEIYP